MSRRIQLLIYRALTSFQQSRYMGRRRGYNLISSICTLSVGFLIGIVLSEFSYCSFSGLEDMNIKHKRGQGQALFFNFQHTGGLCYCNFPYQITALYLNLELRYSFDKFSTYGVLWAWNVVRLRQSTIPNFLWCQGRCQSRYLYFYSSYRLHGRIYIQSIGFQLVS